MSASIQSLAQYFSGKEAVLIGTNNGGWEGRAPGEDSNWKYASATTITVPSDGTLYYSKGDKIRLKQGAGYKYFYITSVATTILTITGGADYTLTNADITDIEVSNSPNPIGFPSSHNWTAVNTGFSANPTNSTYRFWLNGTKCFVNVVQLSAGTSNATTFTISSPIAAVSASLVVWGVAFFQGTDNGALLTVPGHAYINNNEAVFNIKKDIAGAAWTNANGKAASFQLWYEI